MQTKNIKILLVSPYSAKKVGGIGTWTKSIIDYIQTSEFKELKLQNTAIWFKSNVYRNHFFQLFISIIDSILILIRLLFNLFFYKPDVIHYTSSSGNALLKDNIAINLAHLFNTKFVIHFRFGRIPSLSKNNNLEWKRLCKVIKKADETIVIDNRSYITLKQAKLNNIYCLPNPISSAVKRLAISNKINNKIKGKVVFVGHIIKTKGVFELVKACCKLNNVLELVMLGPVTNDTKCELQKIANLRKNIAWLQFKGEVKREEVLEELKNTSIMCLPSYTEGFPNSILEAMALACPIVSTNVGAIPEMLSNGAGICIEPRNIEQLQKAIEFMLKNQENALKMGEKARQRVLNEYTMEKVFEQYKNIWYK